MKAGWRAGAAGAVRAAGAPGAARAAKVGGVAIGAGTDGTCVKADGAEQESMAICAGAEDAPGYEDGRRQVGAGRSLNS